MNLLCGLAKDVKLDGKQKNKLSVCIHLHYEKSKGLLYVTRRVKINHVGTLVYLRNSDLKYLTPHNFPVSDSNCIRFTQEAQQGNSY